MARLLLVGITNAAGQSQYFIGQIVTPPIAADAGAVTVIGNGKLFMTTAQGLLKKLHVGMWHALICWY